MRIFAILLLLTTGCAGLNHDMMANALNNADEQKCSCACRKNVKKKSSQRNLDKYFLFDDIESLEE